MSTIKRYDKDDSTSYALGATLSIELLKARPDCVRRIYLHSKLNSAEIIHTIESLADQASAAIDIETNDKAFRILSQKENCFVIAEFDKFDAPIDGSAPHIVLVNPSNAGNLGTIIRSAVGFDLPDIAIIKPAADIFDPKTVRASMGSLFRLRFSHYDQFEDYISAHKDRPIYPFMLNRDSKDLREVDLPNTFSLVFGNEATGLPKEFACIGTPVQIHHSDAIDSLNLPIALSIGLYSATRSRDFSPHFFDVANEVQL